MDPKRAKGFLNPTPSRPRMAHIMLRGLDLRGRVVTPMPSTREEIDGILRRPRSRGLKGSHFKGSYFNQQATMSDLEAVKSATSKELEKLREAIRLLAARLDER